MAVLRRLGCRVDVPRHTLTLLQYLIHDLLLCSLPMFLFELLDHIAAHDVISDLKLFFAKHQGFVLIFREMLVCDGLVSVYLSLESLAELAFLFE